MNYSKYAPYYKESAGTLIENAESWVEKYKIITNWIRKNDYIRAIKISKQNGLPNLDHV